MISYKQICHLVQVALMLSVVSPSDAVLQWRRLPNNGTATPLGRRDCALGYDYVSNQLYVFGGRGQAPGNDHWRYDLTTNQWTELVNPSGAKPSPRFSMVSGFSSRLNMFVVATGELLPRAKRFANDIWAYNVTSATWTQLPSRGTIPEDRYGATGGLHINGTNFYVTHGFSRRRYSNTLRYDLLQRRWFTEFSFVNPYSRTNPKARCLQGGTMVTPEETMFYGGCLSGGSTGGPCPGVDSWAKQRGGPWREMKLCPSARIFSGIAPWPFAERTVVMFGGQEKRASLIMNEEGLRNEIDVLNVETGVWTRLQSVGDPVHGLPAWRVGGQMVATNNSVLLFGGDPQTDRFVWELTGDITTAASAGSCGPHWFAWPHLHGLFMVISWGFILQAGAFIARYFRHRDPTWFKLHQALQITGVVLGFIGICLVLPGTLSVPNFAHSLIGTFIFLWSLQQVVNGLLRPHKEDTPSKKREYWEIWHKYVGRLFLLLAMVNIMLGLYLVIAPLAVIVVWYVVCGILLLCYALFEYNKRYCPIQG